MKRLCLILACLLCHLWMAAQGIPFIRNYSIYEYDAHNFNFDVTTGPEGTIYVANFEGLLYYDNVEWRIIRTPGFARVTVVQADKKGDIWVAGYDFIGYLEKKANGELYLKRINTQGLFEGEVQEIWERNDELLFLVDNGNIYQVKNRKISLKKQISKQRLNIGLSDIIDIETLESRHQVSTLTDITRTVSLEKGQKASIKKGNGLIVTDQDNHLVYSITKSNGLCMDNVSWIDYDKHGKLWGSTDAGIFSIAIPSAYSRFTSNEGLPEEVLSITEFAGKMYVGTIDGLYKQEGMRFIDAGIGSFACWQLVKTVKGLAAATADGIFIISPNGNVKRLSLSSSIAIMAEGDDIYSGEMDGVYQINMTSGNRKKICSLEKVSKIIKDRQGQIWLQNMFGDIWYQQSGKKEFRSYHSKDDDMTSTIVQTDNKIVIIDAVTKEPFEYPLFSYQDPTGVTWLTDNDGKSLFRWKNNRRQNDMDALLSPVSNTTIRAMFVRGHEIWLGHDKGITIINTENEDPALQTKPQLLIRTVRLRNDSVLWGGYGTMPKILPTLDSNDRNLHFTFSLDFEPMVGENLYRYQLNDGEWSSWTNSKQADYLNLPYGFYNFNVQARDCFGRESDITSIQFYISYPFYMKWYMMLAYFILLCILVYIIIRLRLQRLEREKVRLEKIVQDRTAEVVSQKDEIEEKSKSLEKALSDLNNAQNELIRQEKMATVGKLTQGLIDRILNPLNYINNFSKLSEGLVKDIEANIEDEKDHMDEENYEDTMDVLGMLKGNLQKVGEHGLNTSRTLKSMEEMLKDRSGGIVEMNLAQVLLLNEEMVGRYFAKDIADHHIKVSFDLPQGNLPIMGNPEQLSKTFMSLLGNAIYAVVKKTQRTKFEPEVSLKLEQIDKQYQITIHDNGIGIEKKIINKIFDPFFTTKTTGEASGVGLYLSREIIQNYGGDIMVSSVKDEYSEFIITLPALIN
jgi:signal transduction histidine kinase/ligand-binding sensor domain-containing protein